VEDWATLISFINGNVSISELRQSKPATREDIRKSRHKKSVKGRPDGNEDDDEGIESDIGDEEGDLDEMYWNDDEVPQLFFKSPQQLLEIFAELEENNLALIQNCQETEETLEELKQKIIETEERM
jgi:hypothetical protein